MAYWRPCPVMHARGGLIDLLACLPYYAYAGEPFGLMSRRVLAGTPALVPKVAALLSTCPVSESEPTPPTA